MKIKEGYELRQVGDDFVVITIGEATNSFNGMIKLNKTGAFIWKELQKGSELENVVKLLAKEFEIDNEIARKDVVSFIDSLKQTNCFEE